MYDWDDYMLVEEEPEDRRPRDGEYFKEVFDGSYKDLGIAFGRLWLEYWHDADKCDRECIVTVIGWAVLDKLFDGNEEKYGNLARDVARAMIDSEADEVEGLLTAYMSDEDEDHDGLEESFAEWFYDAGLTMWNGVVRWVGTPNTRRV